MLLVKTKIAPSEIHGLGLFADQDIEIGQEVWRYHEETSQIYALNSFLSLCEELPFEKIQYFLSYSYLRGNRVFYLSDNTKFINHDANAANLFLESDYSEKASRDIKCGEELLENYMLSYDLLDFFNLSGLYELENKIDLLEFLRRSYVDNQNIHQRVAS